MNKQETMKLIIANEYEKQELNKYKPMKFEYYLLEKLAELRVKQSENIVLDSVSVPFCKCNCQGSESDCSNER